MTENCRTNSLRLLTSSLVVMIRDRMIIRIFAFVQSASRAENRPVTEDYLNRFGGIARLYGIASLERFSGAHVMVIGLGGVGSWTVEALARSGIGQFTLVDLDDLCLTNTNRQIHATTETIGQSKAVVLAKRVLQINPDARCTVEQTFYSEKNSAALLSAAPDAVVDAIDSVRAKCHLLASCRDHHIPVIASGGAGGRSTPPKSASTTSPAPSATRSSSPSASDSGPNTASQKPGKKAPKFKIPAVFSPEQPKFPTCDGETTTERPEEMPGGIKCDSGYGAATHLTATFGNLLAGWVLDQLAK
jgi:tRNA A37 threonylcarbamoyladenosine dehydratase